MTPRKNKKLHGKTELIKFLTRNYKKFRITINQLKLVTGL